MQSKHLEETSQDSYKAWKTCTEGKIFFKVLLGALLKSNRENLLSLDLLATSNEQLAKELAARVAVNALILDLKEIEFDDIKDILESEESEVEDEA